jgi:fatty-acyl-CoA synthase
MIVTGGFNVFPREVEDAIAGHPAIAQVGVIGVPDQVWGEAVTAVVVLRPGAPAPGRLVEEIKAAVRDHKGPVHVPKRVIVADRLPLTALGKPDKKALRAQYAE